MSLKTTWFGIKQRCFNPNALMYPRYGGRGITITSEWLDFGQFERWALKSGYVSGLTIDRVNNDGNYEPGNCRWITKSENSRRNAMNPKKRKYDLPTGVWRNGPGYCAMRMVGDARRYLGQHRTPHEAHAAYLADAYFSLLRGEFA